MSYQITHKYELILDSKSKYLLDQNSKICNFLYNKLLALYNKIKADYICYINDKSDPYYQIIANEIGKDLYNPRFYRDQIPSLRKTYPFINNVYRSCLANTALRLGKSLKKEKSKVKFRKWKNKWFSLEYETRDGWNLSNNDIDISLGKFPGNPKGQLFTHIKAKIKKLQKYTYQSSQIRIKKELGIYYIYFINEKQDQPIKDVNKSIYLDPNSKNIAVGVDDFGNSLTFNNIKYYKGGKEYKIDKEIDKLQGKRSKCKYESNKYNMYTNIIHKLYNKKRDRIKHTLYKIANELYKNYDKVYIGNWVPSNKSTTLPFKKKANRKLRNNTYISQFKKILKYVALRSGKLFQEVDESYTTKTCHACDHVNPPIDPNKRIWTCESCEKEHVRDENSGINIMKKVKPVLPCSGDYVIHRVGIDIQANGLVNSKKLIRLTGTKSIRKLNDISEDISAESD